MLEEITNYYHDEYGKFKYNLINVYADNDIEQDEPIGCIQLRIADHTENINNVDRLVDGIFISLLLWQTMMLLEIDLE